jgi:diguanylate cyclase (GGDEF)-like protein/PAS domain S-box-containing protein
MVFRHGLRDVALDVVVVGVGGFECVRDVLADTEVVASAAYFDDLWSALAHLRGTGRQASDGEVVLLQLPGMRTSETDAVALLRECIDDPAIVVLAEAGEETFGEDAAGDETYERLHVQGLQADVLAHALRHAADRAHLTRDMRQREAELRALFDLNPHPMWVYDARSLAFLAVNQVAARVYGYSEQEFLSMRVTDLRSATDAERQTRQAAHESPVLEVDATSVHRTRHGGDIEVEIHQRALPLWGPQARLVQARDVTTQRRAMRMLETSERRFRDLFEHSTGYICIHDLEGILFAVNQATAAALGTTVAELLGSDMRELYEPSLRGSFDDYLQRIVRSGEDAGLLRVRNRRGEELVWQYRNRVYRDTDGNSYVMGYAQDITALRAAEQAFARSERRLRTIADTLPLKIAYLDADERFVFANEAYQRSYPSRPLVGMHLRDAIGAARYAARRTFLARALRGERVVFEEEEGEGDAFRCREITYIPETGESDGRVIGVNAMVQDVTAAKREQRRLIHLSQIDGMTGLMNRGGFHARLENAIVRARDQKSLLAVFYLDIDRFKQVNDTHGHAVGDALIRAFAARIGSKVRASDVVARIGGDEFTLFIEGARDEDYIRRIADKLVAALGRPFELDGKAITVSVGASIGVSLWHGDGPIHADRLIASADALLYEAKQGGRATYRLARVDSTSEPRGTRGHE